MYIWNITLYEPSPVNGEGIRSMRSGMLSMALYDAGHKVELWMPGFEHVHHKHYRKKSCFEKIFDRYWIQYIKGYEYENDVSLKRFIHNKLIAKEFLKLARNRTNLPDLLFTQVPSLELAEAVVNFSQERKIPVIVDIRDPWPDIYKRLFPKWCNFLYPILFISERRRAQYIFSKATAITAVSKSYLEWGLQYSGRKKTAFDMVYYIGYPPNKSTTPSIEQIRHTENKFGLSAKKFNVTFAGTFGHNFDLDVVIKASELLSFHGIDDIQFIIAGKGNGENILLKESKRLQNLNFLGWVDAKNLKAILSISSVGLAPFPQGALNSLPNKPFEYMAISLPIITSLDGELRSLIEEKKIGLYYPAGDAEALVNRIMFLRNNLELRTKMAYRSRQVFEKEFRSELIYSQLAEHLTMIVKQLRQK